MNDLQETKKTKEELPELLSAIRNYRCSSLPDVLNLQGLVYFNNSESNLGRAILIEADSLLEARSALDTKSNVRNKLYLGLTEQIGNNFTSARGYYEKALRKSQKIGFTKGIIQSYLNLANISIADGDIKEARLMLLEASRLSEDLGNQFLGGYANHSLGRTYLVEDDLEAAMKYSDISEAIWLKMDYYKGLHFTYLNKAEIHKKRNKPKSELANLFRALYYSELDDSYSRHFIYQMLGDYYLLHENPSEAKHYFEKALLLKNSLREADVISLTTKLLDLYEKDNEIDKIKKLNANAVNFFKSKSETFDQKAKLWLEKEKNLEAKLAENEYLKKSNYEIESKVKNRNVLLFFMIGFIMAVLFLGYLQYRAYQVKLKLLDEIQSKNDELKSVNGELSIQKSKVEEQKEHLEQLDTMKTAFFTNISHEFRTPLSVINGMTENISGNKKEKELILRNTKNLLNLITQILDLSKLENKSLKVHNVQGDILEYIRYISESFHSYSNKNNIMIKLDFKQPKIIMDYDREKIQHILANLLSNAIKHSYSGDQITLDINTIIDSEGIPIELILSIRDQGLGIKQEDLDKIFDRFYQADDAVSMAGGTGIGLAFTRELVALLKGQITVTSELGVGSTFTIKLPITNDAELIDAKQEQQQTPSFELLIPSRATEDSFDDRVLENSSEKPLLLIIEDNADVLEYFKTALQSEYRLKYAYNGRIGIETALEVIPDIIISDVMMPEKDGYEVCKVLKQQEETSHVPIILVTSKADIEDRIIGIEHGADAYLSKPFHPEELLARLRSLIQGRKQLQEKYSSGNPIKSNRMSADDKFVMKVQNLILENLQTKQFGPQELAHKLSISRTQLHRKLKALTKTSTSNYITLIKLREARKLLKQTDMNISEIAYASGFNTLNYFSKSFSKVFNCSPTEFRAG